MLPLFAALALTVSPARSASSPESAWAVQSEFFDGGAAAVLSASETPRKADLRLSQLADLLRSDPAALDSLIAALTERLGERGQAWLTSERKKALEEALRKADVAALDRFPVLTAAELLAAAKVYTARKGPIPPLTPPASFDLAFPGTPVDPAPGAFLTPLGNGLYYGDRSSSGTGSVFGDAERLAAALNLLADNDPSAPATAVRYRGADYRTVRGLVDAMVAAGASIGVRDMGYYANFGDLYFGLPGNLRGVETPVYVDTGLTLSNGKRLIVPVAHSHLAIEWRGTVNADLTFFFGIDGKASFRANGTLDQHWAGGRTIASYLGAAATDLLARAADVRRHLAAKAEAFKLPMGGYGPLGDCNDVHAFVTGRAAYPMMREPRYFQGAGPLDGLSASLPYDVGNPPDPRRVLQSRPFDSVDDVPFPEVREVYRAITALSAATR